MTELTASTVCLYRLTASDAETVNRRRTSGGAIARRLTENPPQWPKGAQAHIGEPVKAGDEFPLIITRRLENGRFSGQVILDGSDTLWVRDVPWGIGPGRASL